MLEQDHGEIRYHRTDATEETDGLDLWDSERSTQPSHTTLASWNYQPAAIDQASEMTWINNGEAAPQLEDYDPQTSFYGDETELREHTKLRQQAHDLKTKSFSAAGTPRHLFPGANFTLSGHPVHDQEIKEQRQFVVLEQEIEAWNNLAEGLTEQSPAQSAQPPFRTRLTLVRRTIPILPEYSHSSHAKPRSRHPQSARVVGQKDQEITTNERGEILVQYPWQRRQDHTLEASGSTADFDEKSNFWVRVANDISGDQWGSQWLPRAGQEVLLYYIDGDIDRPVAVKGLHNGRHPNPHFSGVGGLPANKMLSGTKTREHFGQGYNELLFDDTTAELRTKLGSEHAKSQLNLGYLTHPRTDGTADPRGNGIELRSDANLVLRGAQGLLISSEASYQARGTQLARQALTTALNSAKELATIYGDLSNTHQAEHTDLEELKQLIAKVEAWEKGSNTDKQGTGGGSPIIAISAAGGMAMSSGQAMALTSGSTLDLVTQQSTQISAGKNLVARVKERISLFAHKLGIKLIAASGKIEIQAHANNIELTAAKNITITALGEIVLRMPKLSIQTQGASYDIGQGMLTSKTSGAHIRHAGKHGEVGPASTPLVLPSMPQGKLDDCPRKS